MKFVQPLQKLPVECWLLGISFRFSATDNSDQSENSWGNMFQDTSGLSLDLIDKETVRREKELKRLKSAALYKFFAFDLEQIKRATEMKAPLQNVKGSQLSCCNYLALLDCGVCFRNFQYRSTCESLLEDLMTGIPKRLWQKKNHFILV